MTEPQVDSPTAVGAAAVVMADGPDVDVAVPAALLADAGGYLRVDVRAWRGSRPLPRAAQFDLRAGTESAAHLVGVVH